VSFDFGDFFRGAGGQQAGPGPDFMHMGLEEILEALGGRMGGAGRARPGAARRRPQRGQHLESRITLDFLQAVRGTTVTLKVDRPGAGTETIDVKIPAGISEGAKVRVKGKGGQGPAGSGDLYIVVHTREHPYFRREGADIYLEAPIGIDEAALGAKVDVPTIDGTMTVTVPAGSPSGRMLRLKGKGVEMPGQPRGDQYVVLRVVPPKELSEAGRELLEKFREAESYNPRQEAPWR
jgi:DnaJ-class molecular chaperone